jgi:ribosomal protein S12 methylthiotransferase accessory factor
MRANRLLRSVTDIPGLSKSEQRWIARLWNKRLGIINAILQRHDLTRYGLHMYQTLSANTTALFGLSREVSSGGLGLSFSVRNAFLASIGEAIERYCMSYTDPAVLRLSTYQSLPTSQRLKELAFYTTSDYRKFSQRFINPVRSKIYWCSLQSWVGRHTLWYPASLVFLPFDFQKPVAETSSTGVSAHPDKQQAILSGVLEVIERDAVMLNFYHQLPRQAVDLVSLKKKAPARLQCLISQIGRKFSVRIFVQHTDVQVPVYLAYIWTGEDKTLHYGIGACAALNSDEAIEKALRECLFTYSYSFNLMDLKVEKASRIRALYEHFLYYQADARFEQLVNNFQTVSYQCRVQTVRGLQNSLRSLGFQVYFIDLTSPDIRAATPVHVIRVVVPGMIDLNRTHGLIRKKAERLKKPPPQFEVRAKPELNREPHPFP